eukprot:gene7059-7807_t
MSQDNLWLKLLNQTSKRSSTLESTCIVVGDRDVGKTCFVDALAQQPHSPSTDQPSLDLINYNFVDLEDSSIGVPSKINLWQVDQRTLSFADDLLQHLMNDPVMLVIVLDVNQGEEAVASLKKWLGLLAPLIAKHYNHLSSDAAEKKKKQFLHYLLTARVSKGSLLDSTYEEGELSGRTRYEVALDHFALPILVVGCKVDLVDTNNIVAMKSLRELQGYLRFLCLEAGATLAFTSSTSSSDGESSISHLRRYILHRLCPEQIAMDLKLQDKLPYTFIPAGFDTVDLINLSVSIKVEKEALRNYLASVQENLKVTEKSTSSDFLPPASFATIEAEQDWLQTLYNTIAKFSAESATRASSNNLLEAIQAEAEAPAAPAEKKRPDPLIITNTGSSREGMPPTVPTPTSALAPATKRASIIRTVAATDKKDVGDFFKNLMETKTVNKK